MQNVIQVNQQSGGLLAGQHDYVCCLPAGHGQADFVSETLHFYGFGRQFFCHSDCVHMIKYDATTQGVQAEIEQLEAERSAALAKVRTATGGRITTALKFAQDATTAALRAEVGA